MEVNAELKQVLEAFANLGEAGFDAFVIWVVVGYLKILTTATAWVILFVFVTKRITAALYNVRVKENTNG